MKNTQPKPMTVKKKVQHRFTAEEIAALNVEFRQSFANLKAVEAENDDAKAVMKAKQTGAESRMELLNATLQAGFEDRDKECVVIFRPADKKKDFFLVTDCDPETKQPLPDIKPVLTEAMTMEDFEQDLVRAESVFDNRKELPVWDTDDDECRIIVGSLNSRWFTAIRGNVGQHAIETRLDSEQRATKRRPDAIALAGRQLMDWLKISVGKDAAKGFEQLIVDVVEGEKEKAE